MQSRALHLPHDSSVPLSVLSHEKTCLSAIGACLNERMAPCSQLSSQYGKEPFYGLSSPQHFNPTTWYGFVSVKRPC